MRIVIDITPALDGKARAEMWESNSAEDFEYDPTEDRIIGFSAGSTMADTCLCVLAAVVHELRCVADGSYADSLRDGDCGVRDE